MGTVVHAVSDGWLGAPWIFWSGLIGSGITASVAIATLVISNWQNLRRQAEQLKHDASENREDRKLSIRREVYLAAVEQAHALLGAIGGLPQRGLDTSTDAEPLQAFLKANAKVWLVAESEAAHLSRDFASQISELFLVSVAASMPARLAMEPIRVRSKMIEHNESEALRIYAQFNDARMKNAPEAERRRLGELLQETQEFIDKLKRVQQVARSEAMPAAFEAFRATFGEMRTVQRSLCTLVGALRDELNLPRDDEEFLDQLRDMEQRAWVALNRAFGKVPPVPMPEIF